ncbi:MAG: histidine phosphatase family protein [Pseudonocardiales bacterium]
MIEIVFETHATTEDNEAGIATGWLPGRLSEQGRVQAEDLGQRRRRDGILAVFTSDLARATETARLAFGRPGIPVLQDWRLRECDYGALNGASVQEVHGERNAHLQSPYPNGESWRQAVERAGRILDDLPSRWVGSRVLVIGHVATRWAMDHYLDHIPLERLLAEDFAWQPGWDYRLG